MKNILVVDDDHSIRTVLYAALNAHGYQVSVAENGVAALEILKKEPIDLVVSDLIMPKITGLELLDMVKQQYPEIGFLIITAYGTIEKAVEALHKGAFDFITKPFSVSHLQSRIEKYLEYEKLKKENEDLRRKLSNVNKFNRLVGKSAAMQTIFNQIEVVAKSDAPVFIQGESGTGKELIAQAIHDASDRSTKAFIKVNCAAIPETLFESTLFGHEKGSFTNAVKTTKGMFEEADGGTFLLDEISEIPLGMQAKLLRVLQEGKISRIGSSREIDVDVRVIATTNRNIIKMVEENKFRSDLFFRLNVFPIRVMPLRNRPEDIVDLIDHFLLKFKSKYKFKLKVVDPKAINILVQQEWPGNVRQLENLIERAILYSGNDEALTLQHFSLETDHVQGVQEIQEMPVISIAEMEKRLIYNALKKTANNRTRAAELLGITVRTLRNKLHEYDGSEPEE